MATTNPPLPPRPAVTSSLPALFNTDEMPRPYPSIFYYALAGMGKTNALRTLAHLKPLVLATEIGNTKGLATLGDLKFAAIAINKLDEAKAVLSELQARSKPGELYYNGAGPFNCLACDSFTGMGALFEEGAKKLRGWDMIWDATKGSGKDPRQAYPFIAEMGRQICSKIMALPVPTIITCREQLVTEGEEPNQKTYAAPELPGQKLHRELPGWFEASLRLTMVNRQRCFITENEGDVISRIRLREGMRLPKYIKPDLGAIIRLLQGDATAIDELKMPSQDTRNKQP